MERHANYSINAIYPDCSEHHDHAGTNENTCTNKILTKTSFIAKYRY